MALAIFFSFCETVWNDLFPGSQLCAAPGAVKCARAAMGNSCLTHDNTGDESLIKHIFSVNIQ